MSDFWNYQVCWGLQGNLVNRYPWRIPGALLRRYTRDQILLNAHCLQCMYVAMLSAPVRATQHATTCVWVHGTPFLCHITSGI